MAVFTRVSESAIARHLERYGLPAPDIVNGIAEGTENTNYKLLVAGKRYILTLFEGRTAESDLPYFLALMDHVASKGLPAPRPIPTLDGAVLTELAERPAALISFLPGRPNMDPGANDAARAGATLARFHAAARDFPRTRPNTMGPKSWHEMAEEAGAALDRFGEGAREDVDGALRLIEAAWPRRLPQGTVHADLFPDNLLLDHGTPSGIIDFYFACTDFLAYDLAVSMNAYGPEAGDVDETNADALLGGYQSVRPLEPAEKQSLRLLLLGSALRFFLTRAVDNIFAPESALYTPKPPSPWLRLMRHHLRALEGTT